MGLLATLLLAVLLAALGGTPPSEPLCIHITDQAPVPTATLQKAIQTARGVFVKAGIETNWTMRHPDVSYFLQPGELGLSIINESHRSQDPDSTCGLTLRSKQRGKKLGVKIDIFYKPIQAAATRTAYDPSILLGMVMAHEIGHFFGLDHCSSGIMYPDFKKPDLMKAAAGLQTFADPQAEKLRKAIAEWKSLP